MEGVLSLYLTIASLILITYFVALLSNKEQLQTLFFAECLFTLSMFLAYFFIWSQTVLLSSSVLLSEILLDAVHHIADNPAAVTSLASLLVLVFFPRALLHLLSVWVQQNLISQETAVFFLIGLNFGRTIAPLAVSWWVFRTHNKFPSVFTAALVANIFTGITSIFLLPLEFVAGYLNRIAEALKILFHESQVTKSYMLALVNPMANSILEIDQEAFSQKYKTGFIRKRPLPRYICREQDLIKECQIYAADVVIQNDPFYQMVQYNTSAPYYWVRGEQIQALNTSSTATHYLDCHKSYLVSISPPDSLRLFSFSYPNLSSSNVAYCKHFFSGAGLSDEFVVPTGWPQLQLTEPQTALILLAIMLICSWILLVFFTHVAVLFCQQSLSTILPIILNIQKYIKSDNRVFHSALTFLLDCMYYFSGITLCLLFQDVTISVLVIVTICSLYEGLLISKVHLVVLGVETAGSFIVFVYATGVQIGTKSKSLQLACASIVYHLTGVLVFQLLPVATTGTSCIYRIATVISDPTHMYLWWPLVFMFLSYLLVPALLYVISLGGSTVFVCIIIPVSVIILFITVITIVQTYKPMCLPVKLRNWKFLPRFMTSLEPYNNVISRLHQFIVRVFSFKWIRQKSKPVKSRRRVSVARNSGLSSSAQASPLPSGPTSFQGSRKKDSSDSSDSDDTNQDQLKMLRQRMPQPD